jgi:hypothetical protein
MGEGKGEGLKAKNTHRNWNDLDAPVSLSANGIGERAEVLRLCEREKVAAGRMRVVGIETILAERWCFTFHRRSRIRDS